MSNVSLLNVLEAKPARFFLFYLGIHLVVWFVLPVIFHPNMPIDASETLTWGHEWQLGYERHPPLASWLAELSVLAAGGKLWGYFLMSQVAIIVGLLAMWRLAVEWLDARKAVISVVLLDAIYYYNFNTPEFNPNVLLLAMWPLVSLVYWRALERNSTIYWLLTGFVAGLAVLAKYYSAFLLLAMLIVLVVNRDYRKHFGNPRLYLALLVFVATITPHLVWMVNNDFTTIRYGVGRTAHEYKWTSHIVYPLKFILVQMAVLSLAFIVFASLKGEEKFRPWIRSASRNGPVFVWVMGLVPLALTLIVSTVFGMKLRSMWGIPLWSYFGIMLMLLLPASINPKTVGSFFRRFVVVMLFFVTAYILQMTVRLKERAHFPGNEVAGFLYQQWQQQYKTPLKSVGGSLWLAGNVAFYTPGRPSVFVELNQGKSPWMNVARFRKTGGVLVWDARRAGGKMPKDFAQKFPRVIRQKPVTFRWRRHRKNKPFPLGWAIVPPGK